MRFVLQFDLICYRGWGSFPADPMLPEATVGTVLFLVTSLFPSYDGIAKSKVAFLSWLKFPTMILMVFVASHSLHRVPWFVLLYLGLHTFTQVI